MQHQKACVSIIASNAVVIIHTFFLISKVFNELLTMFFFAVLECFDMN